LEKQEVCIYCGGDKVDLENNPCTYCPEELFKQEDLQVTSLSVPEQYRGVMFDHLLVNRDVGEFYGVFLYESMKAITTMKLRNKNMFIGSPTQHSKKIWAYACIQQLFRKGLTVFPLFDIMEIKKIMLDMDRSRDPKYLEGMDVEPYQLYTCPYLFVIIPPDTTYDTYDAMSMIKDRRVRRGNSTIFLYSGSWKFFADNDRKGAISNAVGDGSYGTIDPNSFWVSKGGEEK
jgi:hypothetical protein